MRLLLLALAFGCGGNSGKPAREDSEAPKQAVKPPLELPTGGASVQLVQRTSTELPGSAGAYTIAIDDITAGQVGLTIGRKDGSAVLVSKSVRTKDTVPFTIDAHRYVVVVDGLDNHTFRDDLASFTVRAAATTDAKGDAPQPSAKTESERIEALIAAISASGIVFIRNGMEHSASEAADHLRSKWSRAGSRITTAESFIDNLGSTSSQSGEPYRVRLPDGTERDAGPWLYEQLKALDAR
jgi:hypothetical protein